MYPLDPLEQVHRIYGELLKEAGIMDKLPSMAAKLPTLGAKATATAGKAFGSAVKPLAPPGPTGVSTVNINR